MKMLGPKDLIPLNENIVDEALVKMSSKMKSDYIEKNFYEVIDEAILIPPIPVNRSMKVNP